MNENINSGAVHVSSDRLTEINRFLEVDLKTIDGWCDARLWYAIWPLAQLIGEGPIAEIGVFKGKFFIGLAKTFGVSPDNRATAIDVFDMQQFNIDKAGEGNKTEFLANAVRLGVDPGLITTMEVDSLSLRDLERRQFVEEHGRVAFFSVDGCHEVAHTMRDIEFAMEVTRHDGIIAVDDYNNPFWPGVQEAVAKMYLHREYSFVPLAVIANKLLLCTYSYHQKYLDAIFRYVKSTHPRPRQKLCTRFGYRTVSVQVDHHPFSPLAPVNG